MSLAHSGWYLLPGVALALFMVFAMMECMAALLAKPRRRLAPVTRAALLQRLLTLNEKGQPVRLAPGRLGDLEVTIEPGDPEWRARFARVKLSPRYRARLILDEDRHEVRWFEMVRSSSFFLGFEGLRPRLSWGIWFFFGYIDVRQTGWAYGILPGFPPQVGDAISFQLDTVALKQSISGVARRNGWAFRPKLWWFQVRRRADGTVPRGLIPSETRYWSERQFWGTLYPLSYCLAVGWITVVGSGWTAFRTRATLLPLLGFSTFWWAVSGFIMLIFWLLNRPRPQRGPRVISPPQG